MLSYRDTIISEAKRLAKPYKRGTPLYINLILGKHGTMTIEGEGLDEAAQQAAEESGYIGTLMIDVDGSLAQLDLSAHGERVNREVEVDRAREESQAARDLNWHVGRTL